MWAELVRTLRTEKKMSQRALAMEAGIHRGTLRKIEDGHAGVAIEIFERVFSTLGYEIDAIQVRDVPCRVINPCKAKPVAEPKPLKPVPKRKFKLIGLRLPREV